MVNQRIALEVLKHVAAGLTPVDALKAVCGADAVDAMIASLYADLRATK